MSADLHIRAGDPAEPAVRSLIATLDAQMAALYPAESNHLLDIEALRQPHVSLLVAERAGSVSGCGAFVRHADYVEIKRMIVAPLARGNGIGRALLAALERRARADGYALARLETGIHQPDALALYTRGGYQIRGPFGDYAEDPLSVFMEKRLAAEPDSAPL
ncbi:GNAT family N-acetyltransferase [Niveibacterium sp. SC-1]|uniref:GNAT family N-acetyltransferase n=1 Tax=Niveibacterium sp. SC-1 TaxID=3135646 RepID=UPI00311EA51F